MKFNLIPINLKDSFVIEAACVHHLEVWTLLAMTSNSVV